MPTSNNRKIISLAALSEFKDLLTQDFNGRYVPYYGAESAVNLGANDFLTEGVFEARNVSNNVINSYTRYRAGGVVVSDASALNTKIINFPAASTLSNSNTFATQEWGLSKFLRLDIGGTLKGNIDVTPETANRYIAVNSPTNAQSSSYAMLHTYNEDGDYYFGELVLDGFSGTTKYRRDYIQIGNYKLNFPTLSSDKTLAVSDHTHDDRYLPLSGGYMDGNIAMSGNKIDGANEIQATTLAYGNLGITGDLTTDTFTENDSTFAATVLSISESYLVPGSGFPRRKVTYYTFKQKATTQTPKIEHVATEEWVNEQGYTNNTGTVTSITLGVGTGLSINSSAAITSSGTRTISIASGYKLPTTTEWNEKANVSSLGTAAYTNTGIGSGNVPVLDSNGKLSTSVLPALAITDTFVVSTQAAMLALNAQVGDICVRTDLNKSFILKADPASTLANWQELLTPTDAVTSVNGQTGPVTFAYLSNATVNGQTLTITKSDGTTVSLTNTNTNYYHKTGSWNGLTYTAGKVGSPDDLVFTIPTGTTSTTVALGNHNHDGVYLKLAGGTMTGNLNLKANQYNREGALNCNNSDIMGVNSIYTQDTADNTAEGIRFYRDSTHYDSFTMSGGVMYFAPNDTASGTAFSNANVVLHSGNIGSYAALPSSYPNDGGEIKTKNRVALKGYTGEGSPIWYYKLIRLPIDNSGNYASAIINGRIGGWVSENMSSIYCLIWNRNGIGCAVLDIGGAGTMSDIFNTTDIVVYKNSDNTADVYLKCKGYFTFDLDVEVFQSSASITYDGTYVTTTPSGTLGTSASTTTSRIQLEQGVFKVNGTAVSLSGHTHNYAGSSSAGGAATSALKLSNIVKIGDTNQPVYFNASGVPVAISYTIEKSVPSNAVFTDTHNTHKIISGYKQDGTTQIISANASNGNIELGASGITAGWYKRVYVNAKGIVVNGDQTDSDANTWRNIQVGGVEKLGTGTGTGALNFVSQNTNNGDITFTYDGGIKATAKMPSSLKNPNAIKIQGGGADVASYDGSAAKTFNFAASSTAGAFTISDGTTTKTVQLAGSFTDNNQTIKGNGTAFSANDAVNILGTSPISVTANTTNKTITIAASDATTSAKGIVKLVSGDLNGKVDAAGLAASQAHTHSQYLPLSGGYMDGNIAMSGNTITGASEVQATTLTYGTGIMGDLTTDTFTENDSTFAVTVLSVKEFYMVPGTGSPRQKTTYYTFKQKATTQTPKIEHVASEEWVSEQGYTVLPQIATANKLLLSTATSGTVKWSDFSSAGFLKTNASGVISVDTTSYVPTAGITAGTGKSKLGVKTSGSGTVQTGEGYLEVSNSAASGGTTTYYRDKIVKGSKTINLPTPSGSNGTLALTSDITSVSGVNDGTNWTSITIGSVTKNIPSGGSSVKLWLHTVIFEVASHVMKYEYYSTSNANISLADLCDRISDNIFGDTYGGVFVCKSTFSGTHVEYTYYGIDGTFVYISSDRVYITGQTATEV